MLFNLLQIYTIMRLKVTINVQIRNLTTQNKREREIIVNENYDIAIAMSSSRADPVLGHCPGWGYLNI